MAPRRAEGLITIENATVLYRNFSGEEKPMNRKGDRNFCVIIPDLEVAEMMARDGYNIKRRRPRVDEDEDSAGQLGDPYVEVKAAWNDKAPSPQIYVIGEKTRRRNQYDEGLVGLLDDVEIVSVDLIVSPYNWAPGKVTAYLRKMYVTIHEDTLDLKYADTIVDN